jgi:hypothetical protein
MEKSVGTVRGTAAVVLLGLAYSVATREAHEFAKDLIASPCAKAAINGAEAAVIGYGLVHADEARATHHARFFPIERDAIARASTERSSVLKAVRRMDSPGP